MLFKTNRNLGLKVTSVFGIAQLTIVNHSSGNLSPAYDVLQ